MTGRKWYMFVFADGSKQICRGFSKTELAHEIKEHGALISKEFIGY